MKRCRALWLISIVCLLAGRPALAAEEEKEASPWERYSADLGIFLATTNSTARIGSTSAGVEFDVEDTLGLGSGNNAFRIGASWRFTENRRHRVDFEWFRLKKDGSRVLQNDIDTDQGTIPAGSSIDSEVTLDVFRGAYSYSFFQDDRFDLAVIAGLYVAPMSITMTGTSGFSGTVEQSFTAPLPVLGLRADFALTPKWFIRTNFDVFYVSIDDYTGFLTDVQVAAEYKAWKHVGFGLGFDTMYVKVETDGETSVPGVNATGEFAFDYAGIYAYTKIYFD